MIDAASRIEGAAFALFAESKSDAWDRTVGATVEHREFGAGRIVKVAYRHTDRPAVASVEHRDFETGEKAVKVTYRQKCIYVRFAYGTGIFNADAFENGFIPFICISNPLVADYTKWKADESARRAAQALREKEEQRAAEERRRAAEERRAAQALREQEEQGAAEERQRAAEERQRAAEERRAAQALREKEEQRAAEERQRAGQIWQRWIADFYLQILAFSKLDTEIKLPLQALTDQDQKLCLAWANRSFDENRSTHEQWREFISSDKNNKNNALRMWSARSAEKTAISFFADLGKRTVDVSICQLDAASNEWKSHDIEVDGKPIDVKNARASFSSPDFYVEHTIPQFKRTRGRALHV